MRVLQISGVCFNKSPASIFNGQQPRSRDSSSTVFAVSTAVPPPQSPSTIQIVGGNTPGWYGNVSLHPSNKFEGCQEEFDWIDLEADLYHWTKTLRPVQWYSGHIAKTEKELKEQLKLMDVVIEVREARIPMSTSHPQNGGRMDRAKRLKEDSLLLLRGFDSVSYSLSQLSTNLQTSLQGARELAGPSPTLSEIVLNTMEIESQN